MDGLYALKPWYAARLGGLRRGLAARRVSPDAVTAAGIGFAAGAGLALALLPAPWAVAAVLPLLAARLAAANLDGALARETGRTTRWGAVLNELGDRVADLLVIAGFAVHAPGALVAGAALAATLPSWVALAGSAAGAARRNGGPVGKTERCLLVAVAAASGWYAPVLWVIVAGSLLTAAMRLHGLHREFAATGTKADADAANTADLVVTA
ncbi:CDP-alcohol phosphatidyltransferase family protein [Yinghuangia soli]|uniref:CDP-alcohol phosphatidyltransferase family protein n=1 Tax=Yinghuangia soli TaxID=2908204 RepID=A0AA41Q9N9_9ACTN|nr:CDP-alcohol phosphatidyltransferase family protein [Yinghuangia soli]MCF2533801.1 CDP-alcohol phosphatidyltransferase family protein [Yinghuangia soli]